MNTTNIEEITRAKYERSIVRIASLPTAPRQWSTTPWDDLTEAEKDVARSATRETIDAYLASIGDGMPSVEDCVSLYAKEYHQAREAPLLAIQAVRNLMLSVFAKKMEAQEYRIAPDPAPTYHTPAVVQQRREEAASINAVMNPAPAMLRPLTAEEKNATGLSEKSLAGALTTGPLDDSPAAAEMRHTFKDAPTITEATMEALRQASGPSPAGKLTDEQLGEVGAKAAMDAHGVSEIAIDRQDGRWHLDAKLRASFCRAVREAVEKEQAEAQVSNDEWPKIQTAFHGVITPPKTVSWEAYEEALKVQAERWRKRQIDRDSKQADEINAANAKIEELTGVINVENEQTEEIARLTAEVEIYKKSTGSFSDDVMKLQAELASLQKNYEVERNCSGERMTQILNLQREVEKANAELERLRQSLAALPDRWRKDQESAQSLITVSGCAYELEKALKPAPTAEQEMEAAYQASLKDTWMDAKQWNSKEAFSKGWYAARAKEAK